MTSNISQLNGATAASKSLPLQAGAQYPSLLPRQLKVWLPYVHTGSGSDVYTERLAAGLQAAGHEAVLTPVDRRWQYLPWRYMSVPEPIDADITVANLDAGFAFRRPGTKLVLVDHHCVFDPAFAPYRSRKQALVHETLLRHIDRKSLSVCDALVAVSAYTARSLQAALGGPAASVILNGIETDYFKPAEPPRRRAPDQPFGLLFVGNLSRRKGADMLPAIMARLGPGFELRYTLGLRSDDPFADVAGMRKLGRLSQDELLAAYREADLLLFPSRLEGFGYAAAEAMACGTPAVVADSSALPELIDDGVDGVLCPVDDIDAFVDAVKKLAADPDRLTDMGRRARVKAVDKFSLGAMTSQYVNLFERLLR